MPRASIPRGSPRQPQRAAGPRRPGYRSVLVLHCDTPKLRADGLHLGGESDLMGMLTVLLTEGKANVRHINGTNNANLQRQLRELAEAGEKYDVILAVGHSNADGLRVASDHFARWAEFSANVQLFDPRRMILIACKAGVWPAAHDLFSGATTLAGRALLTGLVAEALVADEPMKRSGFIATVAAGS